jgi:hypothetical protein
MKLINMCPTHLCKETSLVALEKETSDSISVDVKLMHCSESTVEFNLRARKSDYASTVV